MSEFDVTIRLFSGNTYTVKATPDTTIGELKALASTAAELPLNEIKLIYHGKILKADEEKLKDLNITAQTPVCMVHQKPDPAPAPTGATQSSGSFGSTGATPSAASNPLGGFDLSSLGNLAGMGGMAGLEGLGGVNMEQIQQAMNNPAIRQQVASLMQNPEVLRTAFQNHPLGRQLAQQNPQLAQMFDNPELASQFGNMMGMFGGMGAGSSPAPGGNTPSGGFPPINFANLLSGLNATPGAPAAGAAAATANPAVSPEEQYREELQKLNDMGFINKELNLQALVQSTGNVDLAVEKLLSWLK